MSEFRSPEQVLSTTALPLQATSASTPSVAASIPAGISAGAASRVETNAPPLPDVTPAAVVDDSAQLDECSLNEERFDEPPLPEPRERGPAASRRGAGFPS